MKQYVYVALIALTIFAISCRQKPKKVEVNLLTVNEWQLKSMRADTLSFDTFANALTLTFSDSTNSIFGSGGCNRFFGTYSISGGDSIQLKVVGRTMAMCEEIATEDAYIQVLEAARTYSVVNNELTLRDDQGKYHAVFMVRESESIPMGNNGVN